MLKSGSPDARAGAPKVESTDEFETYTAPPRVDAQGRSLSGPSRGLGAAGHQFPPKDPTAPTPPLTKANMAKGIGVPEIPRPAPGAAPASWPVPTLPGQPAKPVPPAEHKMDRPVPPPAEIVDDTGLFEVYQRPGLDQAPRTGRGLRSEPPPGPKAADILARMPEPQAEVVTPKRFALFEPPGRSRPTEQDEVAAHLDALADIAATTASVEGAVMSHSVENGPIRTVIHHDKSGLRDVHDPPLAPPAPPAPAAPVAAAVSQPHLPTAPPVRAEANGPALRIGVVQATFNLAITEGMLTAAKRELARLDATLAAHVQVPGAFDTPLAAQTLLGRDDVDGVVVIGCIIQGETGHDELIAHATATTLQALALRFEKPVGLAITGPRMTEVQAWARLEAGAFAVASVVEQARLLALA